MPDNAGYMYAAYVVAAIIVSLNVFLLAQTLLG